MLSDYYYYYYYYYKHLIARHVTVPLHGPMSYTCHFFHYCSPQNADHSVSNVALTRKVTARQIIHGRTINWLTVYTADCLQTQTEQRDSNGTARFTV